MVIFRAAVDRKTPPQQNRVESLNNNRNALEQKAGFTVVTPIWNSLPISVVMADSSNIVWTSSAHCTLLYVITELSLLLPEMQAIRFSCSSIVILSLYVISKVFSNSRK